MASTKRTGRKSTRPTLTHKQRKQAKAQIPGEKAVRQTDKTVSVAPKKTTRRQKLPLTSRAIDRRKHFPEADAPRGGPRVRSTPSGGTPRTEPPVPLS